LGVAVPAREPEPAQGSKAKQRGALVWGDWVLVSGMAVRAF
jgi:hypothetical protein